MKERTLDEFTGMGLPILLTTAEVAESLRVDPATLSRWRSSGVGPRVRWLSPGIPRYLRDDVAAWLEKTSL
jgi:predicted site-specific integrase-resolvase